MPRHTVQTPDIRRPNMNHRITNIRGTLSPPGGTGSCWLYMAGIVPVPYQPATNRKIQKPLACVWPMSTWEKTIQKPIVRTHIQPHAAYRHPPRLTPTNIDAQTTALHNAAAMIHLNRPHKSLATAVYALSAPSQPGRFARQLHAVRV